MTFCTDRIRTHSQQLLWVRSVLNGQQQTYMRNLRVNQRSGIERWFYRFKFSSDLGLTWQTTASGNALKRSFRTSYELDISKIIDCLAVDCPYELYWYEKTASTTWQYGYSTKTTGTKTTVKLKIFPYLCR